VKPVFFKGFVKTRDKRCIEKFKNRTDFKTLEQVQSLDEYAGILADDAVLIDIDDGDQAELLMDIVEDLQLNCRVYQTTRGKHFLFKNATGQIQKCFTKTNLGCGLTADIKVGLKNSYSILKFNGKERFIEWDIEDGQEYEELPKWLVPVRGSTEFLNMDAGDGRNQSLFNYILTLQAADYTVEEARETIRIINRYVLKDPLDETELDVILRDEAFQKPVFFKGTTFLFDKFAVFLKNNHHIKRINGQLHLYRGGIYISGHKEIENVMLQHLPQLSKTKRQEVLSYLDVLIRQDSESSPPNMIAFRNGVYDVLDDSFTTFSPEYVITNMIPWDWNPNAYFELADKVLNNISVHDETVRSLLEEMIGSCFYRSNALAGGKAFILTGTGANGKSTLLDMVKRLLGSVNISVLDMKKLSNSRFSPAMMAGKIANIGDDISDEFINDSSDFKKIVTGQTITAEFKGQDEFAFEPYCKLLFSANSIPRIGKGRDSGAILRRLVIVPFNAKFDSSSPDFMPFIGDDLKCQESMEYLIKIGLEGLKRVLETRQYSTNEAMQEELQEYEETNNPIIGFFREAENDEIKIEDEVTSVVYRKYNEWCLSNSLQPLSNGEFSKQVKKHFDFKIADRRVNGKKCRIFVKG
jgi:putative DNA primase/helicase